MTFLEHIQDRGWCMLGFDDDPKSIGYVDYENEVVTFPLWNLSGQFSGTQIYRWDKSKDAQRNPHDQKYFTYAPRGNISVYGLQLLPDSYLGPIYLVEGIWEVIAGCFFGIPCVAALGRNPKHLMNWINSIPNPVVTLSQPDEAGKDLRKYGKNGYIDLDKDLDDCLRNGGWFGVPDLIKP